MRYPQDIETERDLVLHLERQYGAGQIPGFWMRTINHKSEFMRWKRAMNSNIMAAVLLRLRSTRREAIEQLLQEGETAARRFQEATDWLNASAAALDGQQARLTTQERVNV